LLVLSPKAMAVIAVVGGITALLAALIAFSQTGIKKILAYSTVSQLGLMFVGIGVGAFWAAFLHVVTHAFFKACLFLGAGSVMHGNADEEDITKLGGVKHEMPVTWATFLVSTMAITGIVPLSGFFSKDAIIHAAHTHHIEGFGGAIHLAYYLAVATAACTAFYMMRCYFLTFEGERNPQAKVPHAHESSRLMTVPLVILAALAVLALVHGLPVMVSQGGQAQTLMENFLDPVFRTTNELIAQRKFIEIPEDTGFKAMMPGWIQAWVIALFSGAMAFFIYRRGMMKGLLTALEPARKLSFAKFYVDEFYNLAFIRPITIFAKALHRIFDAIFIDGIMVKGSAFVTSRVGGLLRYFQTGDAQMYAAVMSLALASGLLWALMKVL
jgi:NADH-quinone oxidoreductase subunit L